MLGQRVATLALQQEKRAYIVARNRALLARNVERLSAWIEAHTPMFHWIAPQAGAMAFLRYNLPIPSEELSRRLRETQSVFVVAGSWFGLDGHLRLGIGGDPDHFAEALRRIELFLAQEFSERA
ncbi:hypothetical protein C7I85_13345 [Mesorhizobium soli]|uniref:Aminotransferase class I/classII large domain-containing protein n=1 Tax=Pseudaminobacter soli (ex Li et al. 2025) TaxID=1295366 RepID=A0A2P7SCC3_9HYPH|nr:hypothetical protein C7I85_13345 [Mesorhizobium soli]